MSAKHALVTGAAGFIGSHVAESCLRQGMEVTAVDDLSGGFLQNVPKGARFIKGDLRDAALVKSLFAERRVDYVYHLAAYAAEGLSHFIRRFNYETNLLASINLINESVRHEVGCFVFTSSIAVYGAGQSPLREDMLPRPEDPYGVSKLAVELDLEAAHRMFGLNYVVFRPHNVYGERQNLADRYRNVIGIFMNQVMRGEPMTIFGDGLQTRAFSHVDDVAPIITSSVSNPLALNQIFNVGADIPYTVLELAGVVASVFGAPLNVKHLPPRQEVMHAWSDHSKVANCFGRSPSVDLVAGIKRMAEWARSMGPTEPVRFGAVEIAKNMPPSWLSAFTHANT
ncbi:MAG: NAD-dependent epimerase/dehydratase family protein [Nibricoccus sp.]